MFCRNCGVSIPDDSHFCPKCGTKVFEQKPSPISSSKSSPSKTQSARRIESHHGSDGRLLRDVVMLVGGLVAVGIGYTMWIGSTVNAYLGAKTSDYYAAFGRNAPDALQWVAGIFGAIINIAGAICLYIAVCQIAQRFGAWRKQNKVIGTILAVIICLAVFVCFSLKTSATGQFGVWDYLIMAAVFGGMWRGGKQNDEPREEGSANVTHAFWFGKDDSLRWVFLVAGAIFLIMVVGLLLLFGVTSTRNERDRISQAQPHTKPRSPSVGLKTAQVTKRSRPSNDVGKKPKTIDKHNKSGDKVEANTADIYALLSNETLEKIAAGRDPYASMTVAEREAYDIYEAAMHGNVNAQNNLSELYRNIKAAKNGDKEAQEKLRQKGLSW